jgi:heat shock protein HtpX
MWEAIAANRRRSVLLIALLGLVLVILGAVLGLALGVGSRYVPAAYLADSHRIPPTISLWSEIAAGRAAAGWGVVVALGVWLLLWLTAATGGHRVLLSQAGAVEVPRETAPQLHNVVEEMAIAAGLPQPPRVYLMDDSSLNAFAAGYQPGQATVAVTAGLLKRLSRDELQGVIGHEIGHIRNQDVRFMTLASVMVGAIVMLSDMFLRGVFRGGVGRRSSSRRGGGGGQLIVLAVAVVVAVVAPLAAQLLYFACSRRREYLADASAALLTRYPEGLAGALEKISRQAASEATVSKVVAPLYIVNPLQDRALFSLFSTHPPTEERIRILRSMGGAGLAAYEAAFRQVHGGGSGLSERTLRESQDVPMRPASDVEREATTRAQAVGDVLPLVVIPCPCGVRLKLTPDYRRATLRCPRCGTEHRVPAAEPGAAPSSQRRSARPVRYQRRGAGWESFRCVCGHAVQLSPNFKAAQIDCPKCRQRIEVT